MKCSIVIPSRNRIERLRETLQLYNSQTLMEFEIVVVDDGSDNPTKHNMKDWADQFDFPVKVILSEHGGPARARNTGARHASGDIILFCGDDCIPDQHLVEAHLAGFKQNPDIACRQGLTLWHPDVESPFQNFLYEGKYQADYEQLKKPDGSWKKHASIFCMTTNYSIRRDVFFQFNGFNELFNDAAWEDFEFAIRLGKSGYAIGFLPEALNYHYHKYDLATYARRQFTEGSWRPLLCKLHPTAASVLLPIHEIRSAMGKRWTDTIKSADEAGATSEVDTNENLAVKKKHWKEVLDTATYCGVNHTCSKWAQGWQYLPYVGEETDSIRMIDVLNEIERDPLNALNNTIVDFESHAPIWLLWALQAEAYRALGRINEASSAFQKALKIKPELESLDGTLPKRDGSPIIANNTANLFIVGYPKCGTTALENLLRNHSLVKGGKQKEIYVLLERPAKWVGDSNCIIKTEEQIVNKYREIYRQHENSEKKYLIDASPDYIYFPEIAQLIKNISPDAKVVICLREPLSYLISLHEQWRRLGMYGGVIRLKGDDIPRSGILYEQRINFYVQVKAYFDIFDRSNIEVVIFEEFKKNNTETLNHLWNFLELESISVSAPDNSSDYKLKLAENFFEEGRAYFKQQVDSLSALIGRDLVHLWGYNE
ncbi:glycosyltransferase [Thermodesulfobacteriota bacterium]